MSIVLVPKNDLMDYDLDSYLLIDSKPYEKYGLHVFDPYACMRSGSKFFNDEFGADFNDNELGKTSLYVGEKLEQFLDALKVDVFIKKQEVYSTFCPATVLESRAVPCVDYASKQYLTKSFTGCLIPDLVTSALIVEVSNHKSVLSGFDISNSIIVFYPNPSMAMQRSDVSHFSDFLAYLDIVGFERSKCKFTFVECGTESISFQDLILYDRLILKRGVNNSVIYTSSGLIFNSDIVLRNSLAMSNESREAWDSSFDIISTESGVSVLIDFQF